MVKKQIVEKTTKDTATLITTFGFWSVQLALIIGKLSGADISWWGVVSPTIVVVVVALLFTMAGTTRAQW